MKNYIYEFYYMEPENITTEVKEEDSENDDPL